MFKAMDRRKILSKNEIKRLMLLKEQEVLQARIEVLTRKEEEKNWRSNASKLAARAYFDIENNKQLANMVACENCDLCQAQGQCFLVEIDKDLTAN